jgi:hypothetical protein
MDKLFSTDSGILEILRNQEQFHGTEYTRILTQHLFSCVTLIVIDYLLFLELYANLYEINFQAKWAALQPSGYFWVS